MRSHCSEQFPGQDPVVLDSPRAPGNRGWMGCRRGRKKPRVGKSMQIAPGALMFCVRQGDVCVCVCVCYVNVVLVYQGLCLHV